MDLDLSPEDDRFREEVRDWLHENVPAEPAPPYGQAYREFCREWQKTQFEGGWAGISWPSEYGGCGLSPIRQMIWHQENALANAPAVGLNFVGLNHGGPTLITCGTEEQKTYHLPRILRGEIVWCQGFSEPSAGSDLAALKTRGEIDGDHLVVNGQKIWTSYAELADHQELLVRTDPDASKHGGISWLICDMDLPGIEVRPIRTMTGHSHFSEVFYTDVRIPLSNLVGELNDGWRVTMATLSFERGTAFMAGQIELAKVVEKLIDLAKTTTGPDGRRPAIEDDGIARALGLVRAEVSALRCLTLASVSRSLESEIPGPEGSITKLFYADLSMRVRQLALEILGGQALERTPKSWTNEYLGAFNVAIGGGTSEIQRNIIGERVLGLPRDRNRK